PATAPSGSPSSRVTDALADYTRDPFHGFFEGRNGDRLIEPGSLLDTPNVRRWFDTFRAGLPQSLYTYQLPLERRSGPESAVLGSPLVMFSSYSYLGLIGHPRLEAAVREAVARYGTSTGGVRLLTGTLALHLELEQELARFLGQEAAATFGSGYDANIAAITSLFGPGDVAILDQYAHQSIHDGVRMAGCEVRRFKHNDMDDLERRLRLARPRRRRRRLQHGRRPGAARGSARAQAPLRRVPARRRGTLDRRHRRHRPRRLRGAGHRPLADRHPHRLAVQGHPLVRRLRRR